MQKLCRRLFTQKNILYFSIILVFVKLILTLGMPIYAIGDSAYDDFLFIRLSKSIENGEWLGTYDKFTLLKRPMYAIFLAVIQKLNFSFKISILVLYIASILVLFLALKQVSRNKNIYFLIFAWLLFSPIEIHSMYVQRVYRIAIMPAAVTMVIATLLGLFFSLFTSEKGNIKTILWSVGAGLSFFFFWNLREDSLWLLPFFGCALGVGLIKTIIRKVKNRESVLFRVGCIIVPIIIVLLGNHWIKWENYKHYGVYTDSEMNHSEFGSLMSTMYSVKSEDSYQYVNLTHKTMKKIIAASPSLQTIEPQLDAMYGSGWTMENGEIAGGYITYAFRDALSQAGYYEDAVKKEEFCRQVKTELQTAISEGRLETESGLYSASYLFGKKGASPDLFVSKYLEGLRWVISNEKITAGRLVSTGKETRLRAFEAATKDLLIYPSTRNYYLVGYAFSKDGKEKMHFVVEENGKTFLEFDGNKNSSDVYNHFTSQGMVYENTQACRFSQSWEYTENSKMMLHVYMKDKEVETLDLCNMESLVFEKDDYILYFDKAAIEDWNDPLSEEGGIILLCNQLCIKLYQILAYPVCIFVLIGYMGMIYVAFFSKCELQKKEVMRELLLIATGLMLSCLIVIAGVTYRYAEAVNSNGRDFYLVSGYVMYQLFVILVAFSARISVDDIMSERLHSEKRNQNEKDDEKA